VLSLRPDRFTPGESASDIHWIGSWVRHRTGMDDVEGGKSCPYRDSNSDPSAVQPVASRYTDSAIAMDRRDIKKNINETGWKKSEFRWPG
jgi:hypothetical protein